MTKFLKNVDVTGYVSQTSVTSSLVKTDADGKLVAAVAGTDYNAPGVTASAGTLVREIRNTTGATLTKGTIVYISGATGNKPTVSKAIATGDSTSAQTFGMCQANISNNSNGNVVVIGDITGLDTSAFTEGAQLYLSSTTAGTYTTTKQLAPAHLVYIGVVTRSHPTQGQIEVKIQNGYELDEIHDVAISSLANNQGLFYESATDLWKNKTIATVLGYTPADDAAVVKLTGNQTIGGVKTFSDTITASSTLSINGGVLAGNNIVSMRSNPTGGQFRIEKSDGSLSAYPFYIGADGTALAYYYNAAGALKVLLHTDGTSYFGNNLSVGYTTYAATTYKLDVNGTARVVGPILANAPSEGATGEGLIAGQSFKIDATATGQRAAMYVVSNVLSDTYASGLQAQYANFAGDKGFGFNLNTVGGFELYVKNTSWNKALTIANTKAATFTDTVTATSFIKTGGTSVQFLKADGSVDSSTYLTSSSLSSYLPLAGGTLTGALGGTSATFTGAVIVASPFTIKATNPYIQWKNASDTRLGYIQHATNLVMAADSGDIILNTASGTFTLASGGAATFSANVSASNFRVYNGTTTGGYFIHKAGWVGSGTDYAPSIAAETTYGINFFTNGSASLKMYLATTGQLQLNTYTSATSYTGTAAGYLAFDSSGNVITVAGVAATDNTKLPLAGGALTGPLSIAGTGTYLGDWGYSTLTLTDTGGYPGIFFKNGNNIWIMRRNGADNAMDWAYSTNASAQGTGTFTQKMRLASDEWWVSTYTGYKLQVTSGDQINVTNAGAATTLYLQYHGNAGGNLNIAASKFIFYNTGEFSLGGGSGSSQSTLASGLTAIRFPNQYSSGYTDAGVKLYIFNSGTTIQGFTAGPAYDLQYHASGSDSGRHAFYVANSEIVRFNKTSVAISGVLSMATSGTSYISMGRFPNSVSNSGEAWLGRAADRTTGTMTVQLGGGSATNRSFEVVDYAWSQVLFNVNADGNVYASTSFRAPIFYDSNDAAYYGNFASTSSLWGLAIRGDNGASSTENQIFFWGTGNTTTSSIGFKSNAAPFANPTANGDGYNTYFTMDTVGRGWVFRRGTGGTDFSSAYTAGWILNNGVAQFNDSVRSPIFYDSEDETYYVDPNGLSRINRLQVIGNWAGSPNPNQGAINIRGTYPSITFRNTVSNNMWLRHMDGSGDIQHYFASDGTDSVNWNIKHTMFGNGNFYSSGAHNASQFNGSGAGLTGTAGSLTSGAAGQLTTVYAGAVYSNPQIYFGQSTGVRVAMTGAWTVWSDTLWINGYSGGDVLQMCALHTMRNGTPRMAISVQASNSTSYGTFYEFITSYNIASQTVASANSATNLYGQGTIQRTSGGTSYSTMIQVRETSGFSGNTNIAYAPALGFHWGGVVASSIRMNAGGEIQITNNPGTAYENFRAATITADYLTAPYYAGGATGSSYGSIRVDGTTGGYAGVYFSGASGTVSGMYDAGGNGGTWDPSTGWHYYWLRAHTCLGIGGSTTASGYRMYVNGATYIAGSLYATGDVTAYSDVRKKKDIVTVDSALEKVIKLRGVYYIRIDDETNTRQLGVIAQETQSVVPEVVKYSEGTDEYGVTYGNFAGLFIEAFKEQQKQIEELKSIINDLTK